MILSHFKSLFKFWNENTKKLENHNDQTLPLSASQEHLIQIKKELQRRVSLNIHDFEIFLKGHSWAMASLWGKAWEAIACHTIASATDSQAGPFRMLHGMQFYKSIANGMFDLCILLEVVWWQDEDRLFYYSSRCFLASKTYISVW